MNRIERNDLVYRLAFKMLSARDDAKRKTRERNRTKNGSSMEICEGVSPIKMSDEHFYQIVEFYDFLIKNESLTAEEIKEILLAETECYAKRFKYLLKLSSKIPNFVEELKMLGPEKFAQLVVRNISIQNFNANIKEKNNDRKKS